MANKFSQKKGFYGHGGADDADWAPTDSNPWKASASGQGYNARWDDDKGYERGHGAYTDGEHGLVNTPPDSAVDYVHERLAGLIQDSQPYDPLFPGGSPLTHGKGVGDGPPRYAPKTGPQGNMRKPR